MKAKTSDRLKQIMETRGLRQVDILKMCQPFCDEFGVKLQKSELSQYISGRYEPSGTKLTVLSLALGVPEYWLRGYDKLNELNFLNEESTAGRIVSLLKYKNISLSELEEKTGMSETDLSAFLNSSKAEDTNDPDTRKILSLIANALDIDVKFFDDYAFGTKDFKKNYLNFLQSKMSRGLPMTAEENAILLAYINNEPFPSFYFSTKTKMSPEQAEELNTNEIIIRGRDGSCVRKHLTAEQIQAFKTMIDSLPDAPDDI